MLFPIRTLNLLFATTIALFLIAMTPITPTQAKPASPNDTVVVINQDGHQIGDEVAIAALPGFVYTGVIQIPGNQPLGQTSFVVLAMGPNMDPRVITVRNGISKEIDGLAPNLVEILNGEVETARRSNYCYSSLTRVLYRDTQTPPSIITTTWER